MISHVWWSTEPGSSASGDPMRKVRRQLDSRSRTTTPAQPTREPPTAPRFIIRWKARERNHESAAAEARSTADISLCVNASGFFFLMQAKRGRRILAAPDDRAPLQPASREAARSIAKSTGKKYLHPAGACQTRNRSH